ncbi:MAG: phosphate ABC transporter substrate-binding protein [Chloroflexi bacterium]|nr:phosphate ABC transporter substrate-binding protein [Chloroflexota bacterium]
MNLLKFTSCQAPNADAHCAAIAQYISAQINIPTEFVGDVEWQERERMLDNGQAHVGWVCGLVYVRKMASPDPKFDLLAAPVMNGARYADRPMYFSDAIVRADSPFRSFADLRGRTWAFNEPGSHSGYNVTRWYLASREYGNGFFGRAIRSGAHQRSLQMILDGQIDASAIDSTVLETELARRPELASQIRIIETLGPSPIPPWMMQRSLPQELKEALRQAFAAMRTDPRGRAVLDAGRMSRFALVADSDYDPIREMDRVAESVRW